MRAHLLIILLLIPIAFYFLNLATSFVGGDGDEYLLQSYHLGIAHPCGYPVYLWIGKIFLTLFNNNFNSMNVVSLFFSSLTLIILYFFICKMGVSPRVAILSVLMFSFVPMFWKFAIKAEVYNVNAFFLILTLLSFYIWSEKHTIMSLIASGFLYGMSLGVYFPNILMFAPILIFVVLECKKGEYSFIKQLLLIIAAIFIGAIGPLLYIYFRSKIMPPIGTLYNPDNLRNFILFMTGKQYGTLSFEGWRFLLKRVISYSFLFSSGFIFIGLIFASIGIISDWRKRKNYTLFLLTSFIINFAYFTYYNVGDSYTMMSLSYLIIAIFIGSGFDKIFLEKKNMRNFLFIGVSLLIILQILKFSPITKLHISKRDDTLLNEGKRIFDLLPENSILFSEWDRFPSLLCLQSISNQRGDVKIYEIGSQPRNYKINNEIKTFTWYEFIDNNISNKNRPIYVTYVDNYLREQYQVRQIDKNLFFIFSGN